MSFERAAAFVIGQEMGFVDDPDDPGGPTRYGIALNRHPELTLEDIRAMTPERATTIYQNQYAQPIHFAAWPDPVGFVMLDAAVNMGPEIAILCMQTAAEVPADGLIGPETLLAVSRAKLPPLIARFTAQRIRRYARMAGWAADGAGWSTRSTLAAIEAFRQEKQDE